MPNAAILAQQIQTALTEEQAKRKHFYTIIEDERKMEFINGDIYFQSPAKLRHTNAVGLLLILLRSYVNKNGLGFVGSEKMLVSLTRNDYEPDICFFEKAKSEMFVPEQMQFPAPDIVIEVLSPSTEKNDRETKLLDYAAHGIPEYWIVDAEHESIEQYMLRDEAYDLFFKSRDGKIQSIVLPEFRINIRAIFDEQVNLEELKRLI